MLLHWEGEDTVLLDANTLRRFRVDVLTVRLLSALERWVDVDHLAASGIVVSAEELSRLAALGVIESEQEAGDRRQDIVEDSYWSVFDLVVHRQSGVGGYREAEVRSRGTLSPPAFKPRPVGPAVALPTAPALEGGVQQVLDRRRSIRTYGPRPLRLDELSGLLFHSGRIQRVGRDEHLGELVARPYAAGGARSELELYVLANDVEELSPGAHYYDSRRHELILVAPRDDYQDRLNRRVHDATAGMLTRDPPVVMLITAVFARMMWKYKGIALTTIHKNTGCLFQTLYVVATAMGLAPCAVGGGEETATARWLGLDPLIESQVGCFLVGPSA